MLEIFPTYYHKFRCIAGRCNHNCCIGWEIDIDDATMDIYRSLKTPLGTEIMKNISGDNPHFVLRDDGSCPFLRKDGLCRIISEGGEDFLCDICFLHPRFRNFYSSFIETGLGICCEEVAGIILSEKEKFSVSVPEKVHITTEEKEFFEIREEIFKILQRREKKLSARFSELAERYNCILSADTGKLPEIYKSFERLDPAWTEILDSAVGVLCDESIFDDAALQLPFEQLAVYFVFRHLPEHIEDGDYSSGVRFALISCYLLGMLCRAVKNENGCVPFELLCELVRMYSSEIEYSQENLRSVKRIGG